MVFLAALAGSNPALASDPVDTCPGALDFDIQATLEKQGLTSLEKRGCRFRFAIIGGKGERWQVDVCDPLVGILNFEGIDDEKPKFIRAGSEGCPEPLFGADIATSSDASAKYMELRRKTMRNMEEIRFFHTPQKGDPFAKKASTSIEKMRCLERVLRRYLSDCESYEAPAKKPE